MEWLAQWGVPTALGGGIVGLLFWWLKRRIDLQEKRHAEQERQQLEREKNQQALFLMMMQSTRANAIGIKAIARAVQRIPDAHCNGDMTAALEAMTKHQEEEKEFLMKQGVQNVFKN